MAVNKTAFVVGALGGASVAVAAMAGAGVKIPLLTMPHGGSPVSYTHLDVYKRQGLVRNSAPTAKCLSIR